MTSLSIRPLLAIALLAFLAWQWFSPRASNPTAAATPSVSAGSTAAPEKRPSTVAPTTDRNDHLPPEALTTLRLIGNRGPFPYDRDGTVFGNYEHRLPEQARGYYHEYTVPTPGADNRGARRIITGGDPPQAYYYTDDHYETFRKIEARP
jgi:guanyl-specific ribonuclease Sa